jgi:hypothetical protein
VVCAIAALGRTPQSLPPIELVSAPPPGASMRTEGFVRHGIPVIYLVTSSSTFVEAQLGDRSHCHDRHAVKKLASVIAHEEWHVKHGSDEKKAYEVQLATLLRLGIQPGRPSYVAVTRAMIAVLKEERDAEVLATGR